MPANGHSLTLVPSSTVHAPGAGVHALTRRPIATAGSPQRTRASSALILGARLTPSAGCSRATSWPDSMPSSVATSNSAPDTASRSSSSPAVSSGWIGSGPPPNNRPAARAAAVADGVGPVEIVAGRGDDAERGGAGDIVAVQNRMLHRRRATPRGQQGKVQVDPAVRRDVQSPLRDQRAVRGDRAAVGRYAAQLIEEVRVAGLSGLDHLEPRRLAALRHWARGQPQPAAGRRGPPCDHG